MPHHIEIPLQPHTTAAEAIELAEEIQRVFQLHYAPRYVSAAENRDKRRDDVALAELASQLGIDLGPYSEPGAPGNDEPDERHDYDA